MLEGGSEITGTASVQAATVMPAVPLPCDVGRDASVPVTVSVKEPATVPAFSVSVVEALAPDARELTEVFKNVPVNPAGCADVRLKLVEAHAAELLFFTVTVKAVDPPGTMLVVPGVMVTPGIASEHTAATVIFVEPVPNAVEPVAVSVAVTESAKVPAVAPAVSVRVAEPAAPPASVSAVAENVPLKPAGCAAVRLYVDTGHPDEFLFVTATVKLVVPPGFTVGFTGDRVTAGFAGVQAAAPKPMLKFNTPPAMLVAVMDKLEYGSDHVWPTASAGSRNDDVAEVKSSRSVLAPVDASS